MRTVVLCRGDLDFRRNRFPHAVDGIAIAQIGGVGHQTGDGHFLITAGGGAVTSVIVKTVLHPFRGGQTVFHHIKTAVGNGIAVVPGDVHGQGDAVVSHLHPGFLLNFGCLRLGINGKNGFGKGRSGIG